MTSLPATLVRGDIYYLADGTYSYGTFDDPNSGTSTITIRKAIESDHGTSTGWNSSYGDGQAVFGQVTITTDNWVFDGQRRNANWRSGAVTEYGIRFQGTGGKVVRLDNGGSSSGGDAITFQYIDIAGNGRDTGANDDSIYGLAGSDNNSILNSTLRDVDGCQFKIRGTWDNLVVANSYIARNESNPTDHCEMMSASAFNGMSFLNNVIEDIEGTGVWVAISGGVWQDVLIMGNLIRHTPAYVAAGREGIAGVIRILHGGSDLGEAYNLRFYNNTIYGSAGLWSGLAIDYGSGNQAINNVWYSSVRTGDSPDIVGYNWYYNTQVDGDSSATKIVCTSNCATKFVSPMTDMHLASALAGTPLTNVPLTDGDGKTRGADGTWDRGAFEYGGGTTGGPPLPPTLLPPP